MDYASLKKAVMERLRNELHLPYHNAEHVRDVIRRVTEIAGREGVRGKDLQLLKTAALLHDAGFLFSAEGHEEHSCTIAAEILPRYGYSHKAIGEVQAMIRATRLPQEPESLSGEILADADLDYLGRDDFFTVGNRLYRELSDSGTVKNEREWNMLQEKFLENHRYFTKTSRKKRAGKKAENLKIIQSKLN